MTIHQPSPGERPDPSARLVAEGLLPSDLTTSAAALGLVSLPPTDLRARARGALLGGAIGDALGRPGEARPREAVRSRFGRLSDFVPWHGYVDGPTGTVTDDTQLTMVVAESLLAHGGRLDVDDLARRYAAWLPHGRGKGRATVAACERLIDGVPWWEAGTASAGNGASMRVAPIGLLRRDDPNALRRDAALSAIPTHRDPVAVAGAVTHAFTVAWLSHRTADVAVEDLAAAVVAALAGVHDPGSYERVRGSRDRVFLAERIAQLPDLLPLDADDLFDRFYNGAFVLESVPCALWCFMRYVDDPEEMLVTAASGGHDSDTIAAMAGAYAGALHGVAAFPSRWTDDVEYHDELCALADGLAALAAG